LRKLKWCLIVAAALIACLLIGDFAYSRMVLHRYEVWERSIQRDADGIRVGCRDFTVGNGERALLFVHGYSDSPAIFRKIAPRLAELGFTCRAMLRPGCARPIDIYAQATRETWRAALEREAALLRETHQEVWIVGHSLGGAIAIDYLLDEPEAVDGLVLLAPLIAVSSDRSPLLPARAWYRLGKKLMIFTRIMENPFTIDSHSADARAYDMYSRFFPSNVYDEIFEITDNIEERAGELKVPMLMVISRNDDIIDSEVAHAYYEESSSRRKRLLWMEEALHMIPIDTGWQDVALAISEFAAPVEGASE
jgi:carboxylesterase